MLRRCIAPFAIAALLGMAGPVAAENAPGTSAGGSPASMFGGGHETTPQLMIRPSPAAPTAQIFARQDSRAESLRQSVVQLRTQFENELAQLRTRMRSELVDRTFFPMYGSSSSASARDADGCPISTAPPCPDCETLRAADFDKWFDAVMRLYQTAKSWQDADFAQWANERAKKRQDVTAKKLSQLEDGAEWEEREASFYGEIYGFTLSQAVLVWDVQAAEVVGLRAVYIPTLKGRMDANGKYTRGPGEYGGLLDLLEADASAALRATHRKVAQAWCEAEKAFSALLDVPADARSAAEEKVVALDQRYEDAILACRKEEAAQRDAYAAKFAPMRQRLRDAWERMSGRLKSWRESMIAAHLYAGEGKESIEAQYGDGQETTLADGARSAFLPLKAFARDRIPDNDLYRGPDIGLTNVTGSVPAGCWSPSTHLVASFIRHDATPPTIKYAGLEVAPFSFGLGDFRTDAQRPGGTRSAVALGGRMPEDGP